MCGGCVAEYHHRNRVRNRNSRLWKTKSVRCSGPVLELAISDKCVPFSPVEYDSICGLLEIHMCVRAARTVSAAPLGVQLRRKTENLFINLAWNMRWAGYGLNLARICCGIRNSNGATSYSNFIVDFTCQRKRSEWAETRNMYNVYVWSYVIA